MSDDIIERNEVRIASKPIGDYIRECIRLFKNDVNTIRLSTSEIYKEKTNHIIDSLASFGIVVSKEYKNGNVARWNKTNTSKINENTGRREPRIFFTIELVRNPKIYMYNEDERKVKIIGVDMNEFNEKEGDDVERIGNKSNGCYLWDLTCLFRRYDQVILITPETYKQKVLDLINDLSFLGVRIEKSYIKSDGAKWRTKQVNVFNEIKGKSEPKTFFIIGLSKDPNTYMYTDEERKVEIEE